MRTFQRRELTHIRHSFRYQVLKDQELASMMLGKFSAHLDFPMSVIVTPMSKYFSLLNLKFRKLYPDYLNMNNISKFHKTTDHAPAITSKCLPKLKNSFNSFKKSTFYSTFVIQYLLTFNLTF